MIFAWGFVGLVWVLCSLHIFSKHPDIPLHSIRGVRFFTIDTGLAVFVLGGIHLYVQQALQKLVGRLNIDPENKSAIMRLNRAGILILFLEIVMIYQIAKLLFETFIL